MLDDILDLAADLVGDTAAELLGSGGTRRKGSRPAPQGTRRQPQAARPQAAKAQARPVKTERKTTAKRQKRGEDPWDWKEEKPPWEG